jgi:hypothetical protein
MTRNELKRRFPNATEAFIAANETPVDASGSRPANPEPAKGRALDYPQESPKPRRVCDPRCARITFQIYSTHPADWDNYRIKELQDCLVHAGILDGDEWNILTGQVIPRKAKTKADERTEIEIEFLEVLK